MGVMQSWTDNLPDVRQARDVLDQAIAKAKSDAARLASQSGRACAEALVEATAEAVRVGVLLDPGSASRVWSPWKPLLDRALADVSAALTPASVAGVLSFTTLLMAHGGYVPGFYDGTTRSGLELEVKWLAHLAESAATTPASRSTDTHRLLGFAALATGRADLATALSDDPTLAKLAAALPKGAEVSTPAFVELVQAFPEAVHSYGDLLFAARAFVVHVEERGPGGIGAAATWLHRLVHQGLPESPAVIAARAAAASLAQAQSAPPPAPELVARARALFADSAAPLGGEPRAWTSIALYDVHPLFGGVSIAISSRGELVSMEVFPGHGARVFRASLTQRAMDDVDATLRGANPRAITTSTRMGVAGEARPILTFVDPSGSHSVGKWANDSHPQFDSIANMLQEIGRVLAATTQPHRTGTWDGRTFIDR